MPILYHLHLSRHVAGMAKGPVRAAPAEGILCDVDENGNEVVPDRAAIADCLPACYRKAFARDNGLSQMTGGIGFHYRLYDRRGKYLNTIYAMPSHV